VVNFAGNKQQMRGYLKKNQGNTPFPLTKEATEQQNQRMANLDLVAIAIS